MKVYLGCDHGGLNIKNAIIEYLKSNNYDFTDFGCYTEDSVDYPVYGYKVAQAVKEDADSLGIICCGTGIGISMAANKVKGIRAAVCTNEFMAEMTRRHNNSNILALGGRVIDEAMAVKLADIFLTTEFEGDRHTKRVDMIKSIEEGTFSF